MAYGQFSIDNHRTSHTSVFVFLWCAPDAPFTWRALMFRSSAHGAPLRPPHAATSSRPAGHRLTLIACAGALHDPTFNSIPAAHDVWNLSLTPLLLRIVTSTRRCSPTRSLTPTSSLDDGPRGPSSILPHADIDRSPASPPCGDLTERTKQTGKTLHRPPPSIGRPFCSSRLHADWAALPPVAMPQTTRISGPSSCTPRNS